VATPRLQSLKEYKLKNMRIEDHQAFKIEFVTLKKSKNANLKPKKQEERCKT
jgi:hypothetical protein